MRVEEANAYERRETQTGGCGKLQVSYCSIARGDTLGTLVYPKQNHISTLIPFPIDIGVYKDPDSMTGRRRPAANAESLTSVHGMIKQMDEGGRREVNIQLTYLPDTAENRRGLDAIILVIENLGTRLQNFLDHNEIQATLSMAAIQGATLLTAPVKELETRRNNVSP